MLIKYHKQFAAEPAKQLKYRKYVRSQKRRRKEPIMFDKITARVRKLCYGLNPLVEPTRVAMRVIEGL